MPGAGRQSELRRWGEALAAVLAGNAIYFGIAPRLPLSLQHQPFQIDAGLALDFVICAAVYLAIWLLRRRFRPFA